jgi:hypothetical protein
MTGPRLLGAGRPEQGSSSSDDIAPSCEAPPLDPFRKQGSVNLSKASIEAATAHDLVVGGLLTGSNDDSALLSIEAAAAAAGSRERMHREKLAGGPVGLGGSGKARKTKVSESANSPNALACGEPKRYSLCSQPYHGLRYFLYSQPYRVSKTTMPAGLLRPPSALILQGANNRRAQTSPNPTICAVDSDRLRHATASDSEPAATTRCTLYKAESGPSLASR